jgi:hypothetical protein
MEMSLDNYPRGIAKISISKELGGFRTPVETKDAQLTETHTIDTPEQGAVPMMDQVRVREERFTVGGGRGANKVFEGGFPQVDETLSHYLETGQLACGAFGACETVGTSYETPKTDSIASGQGTKVLTLTTGGLTPDAHIGDMLIVTSGDAVGYKYVIKDNDAGTITVDINTHPAIDADSVEIVTGPFEHTITPGLRLSTYAIKVDSPTKYGSASNRILVDLLGVIMASWTCNIEPGAEIMQTVNYKGSKSIDGTPTTNPPDFPHKAFRWGDVPSGANIYVKYDSVEKIVRCQISTLSMDYTNDAEIRDAVGDFYPCYPKDGTIDINVNLRYWPNDRTFHDLKKKERDEYATPIEFFVKLLHANDLALPTAPVTYTDRYFQISIDKMYMQDHTDEIASADEQIMAADMVLKPDPDASVEIKTKDEYGLEYYEGSTVYVA